MPTLISATPRMSIKSTLDFIYFDIGPLFLGLGEEGVSPESDMEQEAASKFVYKDIHLLFFRIR